MEKMFLVTGSDGHLGSTVVKYLLSKGCKVRGLRFKHTSLKTPIAEEVFHADVRDLESMNDFFNCSNAVVIHTAGIVTISKKMNSKVYDTNVVGTENVIAQAKRIHARLIYVSSVHAITEEPSISADYKERYPFKIDSSSKKDAYSRTKAIATAAVRKAAEGPDRIDYNIVYPSGIFGPGDYGNNLINLAMKEYLKKKITTYIDGGYNLIDVRAVAQAIVNLALDDSLKNKEYLLSGDYTSIKDLFNTISEEVKIDHPKITLPTWLLVLLNPATALYYRLRKMPAIYCPYSLKTLTRKIEFNNEEAKRELKLMIYPLRVTILDTVSFLKCNLSFFE